MRKIPLLFFLFGCLLFADKLNAQNTSPVTTVIKDWTGLLETQTECEIYYSYVKCDEERKVLFKFYNEVPFNQNIKFKVTVKYIGYTITEEKTKVVAPNQTIVGECSSTDSNLFIKLLPQWDFERTIITAEIIQVTTN